MLWCTTWLGNVTARGVTHWLTFRSGCFSTEGPCGLRNCALNIFPYCLGRKSWHNPVGKIQGCLLELVISCVLSRKTKANKEKYPETNPELNVKQINCTWKHIWSKRIVHNIQPELLLLSASLNTFSKSLFIWNQEYNSQKWFKCNYSQYILILEPRVIFCKSKRPVITVRDP